VKRGGDDPHISGGCQKDELQKLLTNWVNWHISLKVKEILQVEWLTFFLPFRENSWSIQMFVVSLRLEKE